MKDFDQRCAYSLQHVERIGEITMEIDHHNPTLKGVALHQYENLFPATRHCNGSKLGSWPSKEAQAKGVRFLNPCKEQDYGSQIFEDPNTHVLIGTTPAAIYHIDVLQLNAHFLVQERIDRAVLSELISQTLVTVRGPGAVVQNQIQDLQRVLGTMIPEIPPPNTKPA